MLSLYYIYILSYISNFVYNELLLGNFTLSLSLMWSRDYI